MAAKVMARKIFMNPQALSMIRVFGIDRSCAVVKPPVPFFTSPGTIRKYRGDAELLNKKLQVDEQQRLLQKVEEGFPNFRGSLLSIQHHRGSGGGEGNISFTTAASVRRLTLQRCLDPHGLPRQSVKGVVCITTKDAFILHNPTTGVTSPWIETTACAQPDVYGRRRQVVSIALGFDTESKKHKVICISSYGEKCFPETEDSEYYDCLVVEVLTVEDHTWTSGVHKWRELNVGPPAFADLWRFAFVDGPLYLDGKIHWLFGKCEHILKFYLGWEDFGIAVLPARLHDSSRHIRSMLMEVDAKVAILKSTLDHQETSFLWICHALSRYSEIFQWRQAKVLIPYDYLYPGSSVVALTGTDLIFIQSGDGRISCYSRKTKVSIPLRIPTSHIPEHFDWGRIIKL